MRVLTGGWGESAREVDRDSLLGGDGLGGDGGNGAVGGAWRGTLVIPARHVFRMGGGACGGFFSGGRWTCLLGLNVGGIGSYGV